MRRLLEPPTGSIRVVIDTDAANEIDDAAAKNGVGSTLPVELIFVFAAIQRVGRIVVTRTGCTVAENGVSTAVTIHDVGAGPTFEPIVLRTTGHRIWAAATEHRTNQSRYEWRYDRS